MPSTLSTISWLPVDMTGNSPDNFVQGEVHRSETTRTMANFVIIPAQGAFYDTDNLRVVYHTQSGDTILKRNNDYRLEGIDFGRTKSSSAKGGVYLFIMVTTTLSYNASSYLTIDYQAFGGYLSHQAYSDLYNSVMDIRAAVEAGGFMKESDLAGNTTIQAISSALSALASRMQYMPATTYVMPTSSGTAPTWKTVAVSTETFDNRIDFSDPSTLKSILILSIFSDEFNMKAVIHVDLSPVNQNLSNILNGNLKVDVLYQSLTQLDTNVPLNDSTFFQNGTMLIPKFRMVVDSSSSTVHPRVYIQMALCSNSVRNVTLSLVNSTDISLKEFGNDYRLTTDTRFAEGKVYYVRSGQDGYFQYTPATVTPNAVISSPNTYYEVAAVASTTADFSSDFDVCSRSVSTEAPVPPSSSVALISGSALALKNPYKIWDGNINLAFVESVSWLPKTITEEYNVPDVLDPGKTEGFPILPFCPGKCLEAYSIKTLVVDIYDRREQRLLRVSAPANPRNPYSVSGTPDETVEATFLYYPPDLATLAVKLTLGTSSKSIALHAKAGKNSTLNERFDLRAVYIQ